MVEAIRHAYFALSPHALLRQVDDEAVILDLASCTYYGLNPLAFRLCSLLANGLDLDSSRKAILAEYDTDEATLAADCDAFLEEMVSLGLLLPNQEDGSATARSSS